MSTPELNHPYRSWAWPLLVAPMAFVVVFAIIPTTVLASRIGSLDVVGDVLANRSIRQALWFSLWQSVLSAVVCLVVALPITWVLSRFDFAGRRLVRSLVTVPFLLPTVVVGVAFLAAFPDSLDYSPVSVICAHAYFNVAVVVRVVGSRWESISMSLVRSRRMREEMALLGRCRSRHGMTSCSVSEKMRVAQRESKCQGVRSPSFSLEDQ